MNSRTRTKPIRAGSPGRRTSIRFLGVTLIFLIVSLTLPVLISPAEGANFDNRPYLEGPRASAGDGTHHLGFKPTSPESAGRYAAAERRFSMEAGSQIATSIDLSSQLPPVGDQGSQGSCVAWATSYYYKSWLEKQEHTEWNLSNPQYQFSPSFVYNQTNGGVDYGSTFPDAFDTMQTKGDVDIAEMPYDQGNHTLKPTASQLEAAKPYRIPAGWSYLWLNGGTGPFVSPNNIASAKEWLNDGKLIVMGIPVYSDFPDFGGRSPKAYYDYNGSAGFVGGHGVCISGYNDNINPGGKNADHRGGFKVVNSWGPYWNGSSKGFVYLSYDFVKRYVWEAWTMADLTGDGPSIGRLSAGSGRVGSSIEIVGNNFGTGRRKARVYFNGTAAKQVSFTNNKVTAVVPAGATAGPVTVCNWDGARSNSVLFAARGKGGGNTGPAISSISPSSVSKGSIVTVSGGNFGAGKGSSCVSFGLALATEYYSWSDKQIKVRMPEGVSGEVEVAVHTPDGGSNAMYITVRASTYYSYYFAEGCTRDGFAEWLCLQNPGADPLEVSATYMLEGGQAPVFKTYTLRPSSRTSVHVNGEVGPGQDVSVKLSANGEFFAERPMYFTYKQGQPGYSWTGGHVATGVAAPAPDWYFAEGTTRPGFEEWLCLQNPNSEEVIATVYYITSGGRISQKDYRLPPQSRVSASANGDVGPGKDISVRVHCDSGIIVERPIYFNYQGKWTGGHDVMGTDSPKTKWYFAEGTTQPGFEEWLAVQNTSKENATLTVHFMKSNGSQQDETYTVGANSRWTLDVNQALGPGVDSSIVLESEQPVVAERSMYFSYKELEPGYGWTGGHNVIGASSPKTSWFFAEGCTYDWADEYLCIANPGSDPAHVTIMYMLETGSPVSRSIDVEAQKRTTVKVADVVARGHNVSVQITSDKPVVAERPMYFNYDGWTGGHDVVGF